MNLLILLGINVTWFILRNVFEPRKRLILDIVWFVFFITSIPATHYTEYVGYLE